jgi:hypothetical protein
MMGWGPVVGSLNQMLDHGLVVPETIVGMSTAVIQSGIGHRPYARHVEDWDRSASAGTARSANFSGPMTAANMRRAWLDVSGM